ncbi:MAG: hypothetical protein U0939_06695 [Pirellulales bacterium]
MGKMLQDEQLKPLASQIYGSVADLFGQVQDRVGLPLDKILAIPQGEFCLAFVPPESGPPAVVILLDAGDQIPSVTRLLERATEELEKQGVVRSQEALGDTLLVQFKPANGPGFTYCIRDGVFLASTNKDVVKQTLNVWNGSPDANWTSLADNKKYTAIMSRCSAAGEERPQVTWFVDPIELFRFGARGNFGAQAALAILPALGLDGLQGIGGSLLMGTGDYDVVQHIHLLLDSPRSGVLELITLKPGDSKPESWAPAETATYMTLHWDFAFTYAELTKLIDSFQTDGTVAQFVKQRFEEPLGVEFQSELIDALEGRVTYLTWFEKSGAINAQTQMLALKLKDAEAFRKTLDRVAAKFEQNMEKEAFGGVSYYRIKTPNAENARRVQVERRDGGIRTQLNLRAPEPCLFILGDYFCVADASSLVRECIATQSDPDKSLASALDYKLVASKISRQTGGNAPGMIVFNRPEVGLKAIYDLARDEGMRKMLAQQGENNPFLKSLDKALQDNPLPPFSVISKYFAPVGGMVTNDETGFHYMTFGLKRN